MGGCPECETKLGDKTQKLLFRCDYCGREFCVQHRDPKFAVYSIYRIEKNFRVKEVIERDRAKEGGHPCLPYSKILIREIEYEDEKEYDALKALLNAPPQIEVTRKKTETPHQDVSRIKQETKNRASESRAKRKYNSSEFYFDYSTTRRAKKLVKIAAILILVAIVGMYFYVPEFKSSIDSITQKKELNIEHIEKLVFNYTNTERLNHGLKDLAWDEKLAIIAREHSEDMAVNNFFSHTNLKGEDPTARARRHDYSLYKDLGGGWYSEGISENIGKMPTGNVQGIGYVSNDEKSIAKAQVDSWMNSPGHRANILNPDYDRLGVGVAHDGTYYISTQNFW